MPGTELRLPFLVSEGPGKGRITLERLVEVTSGAEARARRAARKRGLRAGGDADLVLIDPFERSAVRGAVQQSRAKWTPFEGWTFTGRVRRTVVRGRLVFDAGAGVVGEPGWGAFVRRGASGS